MSVRPASMIVSPWHSVLPAELAVRAIDVAMWVAARLRDHEPDNVESDAGRAVLFGQLDEYAQGRGWASAAHGCLTSAARAAADGRFLGLFGGLGGVAFAAHSLSRQGTRYQRLLTELDRGIVAQATARGDAMARTPNGLAFHAFDVIAGLAGTGAYLLCRRGEPGVDAAIRAVLNGLVLLCDQTGDLPNWHTPPEVMTADTPMTRAFPGGVLNCGLAHGVPGPLAMLSLAELAGISVAGQQEAIERVARWLAANRSDDRWGPNWPTGIAMLAATKPEPTHNAWCYGSPGVARALWLAGTALDDEALRTLAVDTMAAVYRRPASARRIDASPGLCHGVAGLLQITLRFARDTGDIGFADAAVDLTNRLLGRYEPDRAFGYGSITDDGSTADEPGLLDGAAGVALALFAAGTDVSPAWDRLLLLS